MSKDAQAFAMKEAFLVVDVKLISSDLDSVKGEHAAYVTRIELMLHVLKTSSTGLTLSMCYSYGTK